MFSRIRRDAISGKTSSTAWSEWSVDEIGDVSDRSRWADANPSMGLLIKETTIQGELEQLSSDRFARERLGWWSDRKAASVIDRGVWDSRVTDDAPEGMTVFAVKFSTDGLSVAVSAAVKTDDGAYVELIFDEGTSRGISWLSSWLAERAGKVAQIVIDGKSGSSALIESMKAAGVRGSVVVTPTSSDVATACSMLVNAVNEGTVSHMGQGRLGDSLCTSEKRKIGSNGGWGFGGSHEAEPWIAESCALAYWMAMTTRRNPSRKQRIG